MNTWRDENPGFDYREWNDSSLSAFGLVNRNVYERFMSEGIYDGAADVARVEILYRFGGVYVDADSIAVKPMRDDLLDRGFFAVREPESGMEERGLVGNACMGAVADHPVLERLIEAISRVVDVRPMWRLTGPGALTDVLARSLEPDINVLPAWIFYDTALDGSAVLGGEPFARHFWSTTVERWSKPGGTPYPVEADPS
jgi:mannosyltransferase OCH1-like enzyme